MRPIMLATDGSPSAEAATDEAISLAKSLGLPLAVVCVEHDQTPMYGYYGYAEVVADLHKIQQENIERALAAVERKAGEAGVSCLTFAPHGVPGEEICKLAAAREARLLVVGAHGWNSVGRLIHGSVSTYVLHHASTPVLVVQGKPQKKEDKVVPAATAA
ncbi:MAG TPA: universal stress protein [Gaiellaceae bacterium]|nr:universal stress protein [Gaiellaceae bacterium]